MSFAAAKAAIRARMTANWTATPIAHPNEPFALPDPPAAYVFFEVVGTDGDAVAFGSPGANRWQNTGQIWAHVFVPSYSGDELATTHAAAIGAIFRGVTFSDVTCFAPVIDGGAKADQDGNWYRVSVRVDFKFGYFG